MVDTVSLIAYCGFVLVVTISIIDVFVPFWNWSLTAFDWSVIPR
jgi:hypothetical protein